MARLSDVNSWLRDPDERWAATLRAVADSSRCEGIEVAEQEIAALVNEARPLRFQLKDRSRGGSRDASL
jgi:hypothetical protein